MGYRAVLGISEKTGLSVDTDQFPAASQHNILCNFSLATNASVDAVSVLHFMKGISREILVVPT